MAQASAEIREHTGPVKKEKVTSVPQSKQLATMPEPPLPKGNGTEHQIMRWERVKVSESRTLARGRRIRAEEWRGKRGLHSEGIRLEGEKGGQARRAYLEELEGSMSG